MNNPATWSQLAGMMPRRVPDTPVVLGPIGSCPHHDGSHLRSQLRGREQKCERMCEHQLHDQTRPTTQLPHVPYTTPYAWKVHWWAPQSWVISPPFTPIFTLRAGPSHLRIHLSVRSERYLCYAFELVRRSRLVCVDQLAQPDAAIRTARSTEGGNIPQRAFG